MIFHITFVAIRRLAEILSAQNKDYISQLPLKKCAELLGHDLKVKEYALVLPFPPFNGGNLDKC